MSLGKTFIFICHSINPTKFKSDYLKIGDKFVSGVNEKLNEEFFRWTLSVVKNKSEKTFEAFLRISFANKQGQPSLVKESFLTIEETTRFTSLPYKMFETTDKNVFLYYGDNSLDEVNLFVQKWIKQLAI